MISFITLQLIESQYAIEPIPENETQWLEWNYADFEKDNQNLDRVVDNHVSNLNNAELAGMVLMPALEKNINIYYFSNLVKKYNLGGYMVLGRSLNQQEQTEINKSNNGLPLLLSVDAEPSLLKYRLPGLDFQNNTQDLNTDKKISNSAHRISSYLKNKKVNINFAPVYDNAKNTEVIGKRSFSTHNKIVQNRAQLFADIMYADNIFPTAKHFPGHGNVTGDTHKKLSTINGDLGELDNFKYAIKNNIPIIMIGHLAIENNRQWNTAGKPSTLSKNIMTDLLRNELDFNGIIITDAMNMGALSEFDHVELQALKSGADIVLMPRNIDVAYNDIFSEIQNNPEFRNEVLEKVRRIIKMRYVIKNSK